MDAIQVLRQDHRSIEKKFKEFEQTSPKANLTKKRLVKKMIKELSLHADVEEQLFYPAVEEAAKEHDLVLKAMEEHDLVKVLLEQLDRMSPEEDRFDAKVAVLIEIIRDHVDQEERHIFPKLKAALKPAQLRDLGIRLDEGKKAIQSPKDYLRRGS
jgi:hemerythrin superfamily protein